MRRLLEILRRGPGFVWTVSRKAARNDLHNHAAEMAYFSMMSVFPFFLLLISLVAFLPVPELFGEAMSLLGRVAPARVVGLLEETVREITSVRKEGLLSVTLLLCTWMSMGAMSSTTRGLNKAFGLEDPRHYLRFFGLSLVMTLMTGVLLLVAVVLILLGPWIQSTVLLHFDFWGLGDTYGHSLLAGFRWLVAIFFLLLVHAMLYWRCPAVQRRFRLFTPGTVFALVAWIAISRGLQIWLSHFDNYDKLYGSLGAVVLTLVWFYTMSFVLLLGGQIDAILHPEYKTPRDDKGRPINAPFPTKLVLATVLILVGVPLGLRLILRPELFAPVAREIGGEIGDMVRKSLESGDQSFDQRELEAFLGQVVDESGRVDYGGAAKKLAALEPWFDRAAQVEIGRLAPAELHALVINLHNAAALRLIAEQKRPIHLLKDIADAKERPLALLGGRRLSLNEMENRILRPFFADPRDHFALADGTMGSGRLRPFAYTGAALEEQLGRVTREALTPPRIALEEGKLRLPQLLSLYRRDFDREEGGLVGFLVRRIPEKFAQLLKEKGESVIDWVPFDGTLNARE